MTGRPKTVAETVGASIRQARKRRGWLLEDLSEHCTRLNGGSNQGYTVAALSRLERGIHEVTTTKLLVIAAALSAPPLSLLVPLGTTDEVEVLPGMAVHPHRLYRWLSSEEGLLGTAAESFQWERHRGAVTAYERLWEVQRHQRQVDPVTAPADAATARDYYDRLGAALLGISELRLDPPAVDAWTYGRLIDAQRHPDGLGVALFEPSSWRRLGNLVPMQHRAMDEPVEVPEAWAETLAGIGWRKVKR